MNNGKLVYIEGSKETVLKNDAPFALLQSMRSEMIRKGYDKLKLKIRYKWKYLSQIIDLQFVDL